MGNGETTFPRRIAGFVAAMLLLLGATIMSVLGVGAVCWGGRRASIVQLSSGELTVGHGCTRL